MGVAHHWGWHVMGAHQWGWHNISWGFDFGLFLVYGWQGGRWHPWGGKSKGLVKPEPLELQYYFAPLSKAAK